MNPPIFFTTYRPECTCDGVEPHAGYCAMRCQHEANVDRFGDVDGTARPTSYVVCEGNHDHSGVHHAVSRIGGHTVWWSDRESRNAP